MKEGDSREMIRQLAARRLVQVRFDRSRSRLGTVSPNPVVVSFLRPRLTTSAFFWKLERGAKKKLPKILFVWFPTLRRGRDSWFWNWGLGGGFLSVLAPARFLHIHTFARGFAWFLITFPEGEIAGWV